MNKELQSSIERELIESFTVFYSSLNQHLKNADDVTKGTKKYVQDIKDLMTITDDADLKVKFIYELPNGDLKHSTYQPIQEFIKNGITMPEDVERFRCVIRAEFRKDETKYQSTDEYPFFKSETFVIKENAKSLVSKLYLDAGKENKGKAVVVSASDLQTLSNNRIRIAEPVIAEI